MVRVLERSPIYAQLGIGLFVFVDVVSMMYAVAGSPYTGEFIVEDWTRHLTLYLMLWLVVRSEEW